MKCATHIQRARDEDVHDCLDCRRALEEQRSIKALLAQVPAPKLASDRRAALAAEVMARADLHDETHVPSRRPLVIGGMAGFVVAAAGVLLFVREDGSLRGRLEARAPVAAVEAVAPAPAPSPEQPAPRTPDVVVAPAPVPIVEESLVPAPEPKKLDRTRHVFGATTDKQRASIERDTIDIENTGVVAFRTGWEALRAQRYAEAIAAFDRATDPAVEEDAVFWSAIAAQRGGDLDDARKRLDSFLSRFPSSPRADDARRAREVLR